MKISSLLAFLVPELRGLNWGQLLKVWGNCTPYSRNMIYFHMVLMLAACSLIFNTFLKFSDSWFGPIFGLILGLLLPANIYFWLVFKNRRNEVRQFINDHWQEFQET